MGKGFQRNIELNSGAPAGWNRTHPHVVTAPLVPARPVRLFGIISTWNDYDIIEANIRNCLAHGCERVFVLDNASSDDTAMRAMNCGAEVKSYATEFYDDDLRITMQNTIMRDVSAELKAPEAWWLTLDADEFITGRDGTLLFDMLGTLPREINVIGSDCVELFPTSKNAYTVGKHPAACMDQGIMRRGGWGMYCEEGYWKHPLVKITNGEFRICQSRGNHMPSIPHGESTPLEPDFAACLFHAPLRNYDDMKRRLDLLCSTGRNRWDDEVTLNNGAVKRYRSLESVYAGKWHDVDIPHTQMYGRSVRGLTLYPWRKLMPSLSWMFGGKVEKNVERAKRLDHAEAIDVNARKLSAVVCSVGYADKLRQTLPWNLDIVDEVIVVTTSTDIDTQAVVKEFGAKLVISDRCYDESASFNKGKMINDACAAIDEPQWVVLTDADIFLNKAARSMLQDVTLDPTRLYFTRRLDIQPQDVEKFVSGRFAKFSSTASGNNNEPSGYFQLFHRKSPPIVGKWPKVCSEFFPSAGGVDWNFVNQWESARGKIWLIPEIPVYHIAHASAFAQNWNGTQPEKKPGTWRQSGYLSSRGIGIFPEEARMGWFGVQVKLIRMTTGEQSPVFTFTDSGSCPPEIAEIDSQGNLIFMGKNIGRTAGDQLYMAYRVPVPGETLEGDGLDSEEKERRRAATQDCLDRRRTRQTEVTIFAVRNPTDGFVYVATQRPEMMHARVSYLIQTADWPYPFDAEVKRCKEALAWERELANSTQLIAEEAKQAAVKALEEAEIEQAAA